MSTTVLSPAAVPAVPVAIEIDAALLQRISVCGEGLTVDPHLVALVTHVDQSMSARLLLNEWLQHSGALLGVLAGGEFLGVADVDKILRLPHRGFVAAEMLGQGVTGGRHIFLPLPDSLLLNQLVVGNLDAAFSLVVRKLTCVLDPGFKDRHEVECSR